MAELITKEDLQQALAEEIDILYEKRKMISISLSSGTTLRRTPIDSLQEKGLMEASAMMEELDRIGNRKSNLSSNERRFCKELFKMACYRHANKLKQNIKVEEDKDGKA